MDYLRQKQWRYYLESKRNLRNYWEGTMTAGLAAVKLILRESVIDKSVRKNERERACQSRTHTEGTDESQLCSHRCYKNND